MISLSVKLGDHIITVNNNIYAKKKKKQQVLQRVIKLFEILKFDIVYHFH